MLHLGGLFSPVDGIALWYLGLVEGIAGVQGLANGQETKRRCFWKKTFIARYDFMDNKGCALGLGKQTVW